MFFIMDAVCPLFPEEEEEDPTIKLRVFSVAVGRSVGAEVGAAVGEVTLVEVVGAAVGETVPRDPSFSFFMFSIVETFCSVFSEEEEGEEDPIIKLRLIFPTIPAG